VIWYLTRATRKNPMKNEKTIFLILLSFLTIAIITLLFFAKNYYHLRSQSSKPILSNVDKSTNKNQEMVDHTIKGMDVAKQSLLEMIIDRIKMHQKVKHEAIVNATHDCELTQMEKALLDDFFFSESSSYYKEAKKIEGEALERDGLLYYFHYFSPSKTYSHKQFLKDISIVPIPIEIFYVSKTTTPVVNKPCVIIGIHLRRNLDPFDIPPEEYLKKIIPDDIHYTDFVVLETAIGKARIKRQNR
jgi:hypothetical protein